MLIDAHQHFWELGRFDTGWLEAPRHKPINRSFLPADLKPLIDTVGVTHTVFVQTQHNLDENRWALELTARHEWIAGVVGWVDLASTECERQLLEFNEHPRFVGIRHITQGEPDDDFIIRPDVLRGLKVLERHKVPFDLLFYVKHLQHAQRLAQELPELKMVIDHLAKPEIKAGRLDNWEANFRAAAKFPNMHCKLSGMVTEADWQAWRPDDLRRYVDIALDAFGPDRLMYGSDWPVCLLAATYERAFHTVQDLLSELSPDEQAHIYHRTAREFYQLDLS
ncbi:MAG: amidohydrolase family protein [Planctomycetaceae bacterium]